MENTGKQASVIMQELKQLEDMKRAHKQQSFFKTGKGDYGEGDIFLGVKVPWQRKISKRHYANTETEDIRTLLSSPVHEHRLTGTFILVLKYQKTRDKAEKENLKDVYLDNTAAFNNWDLVDSSAHHILGHWLHDKSDKKILYHLARSEDLWEQRIAMIACMYDIKKGRFETAFDIAEILLYHKHDLIHKAVGWMLREIGKKDADAEESFLKKHYREMPRTMLRYAIERFPDEKRQAYLKGEIR
ncbi:MAG: DNA alkylation repair protein [Bacteroidota bacterium]